MTHYFKCTGWSSCAPLVPDSSVAVADSTRTVHMGLWAWEPRAAAIIEVPVVIEFEAVLVIMVEIALEAWGSMAQLIAMAPARAAELKAAAAGIAEASGTGASVRVAVGRGSGFDTALSACRCPWTGALAIQAPDYLGL